MEKSAWREGQEGWEVRWMTREYVDPDDTGTGDPDQDEWVERNFPDRESALTYARRVWPRCRGRAIELTRFRLERLVDEHPFHALHNCSVEWIGETEEYQGEEEPSQPL